MCCKDHLHCCPEGTTCNSAAGKCDRGESSVSMTWFTKTAATPVREEKTSSAVLCPDGKGTCPEGSTCCLLASGQYGCCPLPKVACGFEFLFFFLFGLNMSCICEKYLQRESSNINRIRLVWPLICGTFFKIRAESIFCYCSFMFCGTPGMEYCIILNS